MSKGRRAKEDALAALHATLAETFAGILKDGEVIIDKQTGEPMKVTPGASTLNAVRQFLKDNSITADLTTSEPLQALAEAVPNFEPDEFGFPN